MEIRLHTILLTALAAMLAACGQPPDTGTRVSFMDVAQSAAREEDRVSVEQLAEWLIEERRDFVLIDVRSQDDFTKGKIHEARNLPLADLVTSETIATLPPTGRSSCIPTARRTPPRLPRCCAWRDSMRTW